MHGLYKLANTRWISLLTADTRKSSEECQRPHLLSRRRCFVWNTARLGWSLLLEKHETSKINVQNERNVLITCLLLLVYYLHSSFNTREFDSRELFCSFGHDSVPSSPISVRIGGKASYRPPSRTQKKTRGNPKFRASI